MPEDEEEELLAIEEKLGDYFEELDVVEEKIGEQMAKQSSSYVYYARVAAFAKRKMMRKDLEIKRYEALTAKDIRLEAISRGEKVTNQIIEDDVRSKLEWKRLNEELIDLKANLDLSEGIREGFFQRKSMLEYVGRFLMKELDGDTYLKKKIEQYRNKKTGAEK